MTSFAFILGVVPLMVASGAGRREPAGLFGTVVFGGMLASTLWRFRSCRCFMCCWSGCTTGGGGAGRLSRRRQRLGGAERTELVRSSPGSSALSRAGRERRGANRPYSSPSSTSGQWIPNPPPAIRQFARCSGSRDRRRGYHHERHRDRAAVQQIDDQDVFGNPHVPSHARPGVSPRNFIPGLQKP
jgi:hypothetical protein